MKKFFEEFKAFALKGNMMDLAVGVIIGGAFNSIITSLVNDVFMPVISLFTGKIDFTNLFIALDGGAYKTLEEAQTAGASVLAYGSFITALINFIILAFVVFLIVRALNKMEKTLVKEEAPAAPTTKKCPFCLSDIPLAATRCPHCGAEIPAAQVPCTEEAPAEA